MKHSLHALKSGKDDLSIEKKKQIKIRKKRKNKNITSNKRNKKVCKPLLIPPDKKMRLLLKRTLFLKEISKIEGYINSERFLCEKINLSYEEFNRLIMEYNYLINLQKLNFCFEDIFKSISLQNKIINILKKHLINKIEKTNNK